MPSVHDNRIKSFTVDGEARTLTLRTVTESGSPVDLVFSGVEAYFLEHDNFGNIILAIEEFPVSRLIEENRERFENGRRFGWPGPWNQSLEASLRHFEATAARAFELSSSYGMTGWVVCQELVSHGAA